MNSNASMEYDYAHGSGNETPLAPFGLVHMQPGSRCPAVAARRSLHHPDLPNPYQYYGYPPSSLLGGFATGNRVHPSQQWPFQQVNPNEHIGESLSGSPEASQARNSTALHQLNAPGPAYPTYLSLVPPPGSASAPPEIASVGASVSFSPSFSSSPSIPDSVPATDDRQLAVGSLSNDHTASSAGLPGSPAHTHTSAPPSESIFARGTVDSMTALQGSAILPVPSSQQARHVQSSHQTERDTTAGRLPNMPVATGTSAAATAASPTSSLDDESDIGVGQRHPLFLNYFRNTRQSQLLRGQMSNKRVASKKAIQSLERVALVSLPDNEKTCVICYNDFGVASPEGIIETPLRLPKCKHVFGDKCILKWLEDSCSCPYCRDKLESEPVRPNEAMIRRLLETETEQLLHASTNIRRMMAASHGRERLYAPERIHATGRRTREHEVNRESTPRGERRSIPSAQSGDAERRTRSRYDPMHTARAAAYESLHNPVVTPNNPTASMVQPPNQSSQSPLSRALPAWQQTRHMEPQSLRAGFQSTASPGFVPHSSAGAQQTSLSPPNFGPPFAPLPPPIAIASYPYAMSNTQGYILPPFIPPREYLVGEHVMPGHNIPGSSATSGIDSGFAASPALLHPPSQLPGFPDLLSQLPRENNSRTQSYALPGPL